MLLRTWALISSSFKGRQEAQGWPASLGAQMSSKDGYNAPGSRNLQYLTWGKEWKEECLMFITAVMISQWGCVALFQIYSWDLWMSQGSACSPKDTLFACTPHSINKKWKCQRHILKHSVIKQLPADLVLFGHYSPTSSPCMLWWAGDVWALLPGWEWKQREKRGGGELSLNLCVWR